MANQCNLPPPYPLWLAAPARVNVYQGEQSGRAIRLSATIYSVSSNL